MATKKTNKNLVGLVLSVLFIFVAPLLGLLVTVVSLGGAFQATSNPDAAERSTQLSESISQSMQGTVCGLVAACLALIAAIVFGVRLYRDGNRKSTKDAPN